MTSTVIYICILAIISSDGWPTHHMKNIETPLVKDGNAAGRWNLSDEMCDGSFSKDQEAVKKGSHHSHQNSNDSHHNL